MNKKEILLCCLILLHIFATGEQISANYVKGEPGAGRAREKRSWGGFFQNAVNAVGCMVSDPNNLVNGKTQCEPTCNGKTTDDGGCDFTDTNSGLIEKNGNVVTHVNGDCPSDNSCNCPTPGFYSTGPTCALCTAIANCNYRTCSSSSNQVCSYCEGVVHETAGWRAYKISGDKKQCNKACSWRSDSNRCYPGTCPTELVTSCTCSTSFSGTHCRTITESPTISYNALTLETTGTNEHFPPDLNSGPSATQSDVWTNDINPDSIKFEFHSQFQRSMPSPYPAYIKSASVGVSAASATFKLFNKAGTQKGSTLQRACGGVNGDSPNTNMLTCTETFQKSFFSPYLPSPFAHEDWIEFTYESVAGGYVTVENKENNNALNKDYFATNTKTHVFQVHFDTVVPYHCLTSCSTSMLDVLQITTTATVNVAWGGWADDAAGLWKFGIRVYDLTPINSILQHSSIDGTAEVVSSAASGLTTYTIKNGPGIYALLLDAYDRAGNTKSARKLVLYDDGSKITRNAASPLRVTSAAAVTSWTWQQTEGAVTLTWTGRYTNTFHDHNKVLNAVAAESDVETSYDDSVGNMTVTSMSNALGIVKFTTSYSIDQQGGTTLTLPADSAFTLESDLSGGNTYQANVLDGDTLRFWVRAYDIRGIYDEESVTIHVDSSPPVIENLWLTKDHILNLSVHGLEELNQMTIEWESYDEHSGLREVQWRVFDNFTGQDIIHGQEFVHAQGQIIDLAQCESQWSSYVRGPSCYCTGPVGCYHQHFQVQPAIVSSSLYSHGGIFHDKNSAVHDYDYLIEVTVYNHANLSTTLRKQITVDLSPPHPGKVHDGTSGSPEVDYQTSLTLHAYWWGFFDRESGVKYYQYAFHTACVPASAFSHDTTDPRVTQTYEQFASWTAPDDGTYYTTVVAFNSAQEPSEPVCSDGVVVDNVSPVLTQLYVQGAHIVPGVVTSSAAGSGVYFMDSERRLRPVQSPDAACVSAASGVTVTPDRYAVSPLTAAMNATEACAYGTLDAKFLNSFYLAHDMHLFLNWTGSDVSSGIFDYEVGLSSTSSAAVPDISGYQSTHQHSFYKQHHPSLTEGTDFYILVKAIDKAGVEAVESLGPVKLVRTAPTYTGTVTLTLTSDVLKVTWDNSKLTDVEPSFLDFEVALEEEPSGTIIHSYAPPQPSPGSCVLSYPPSCATFSISTLHWGLHEAHTYVAKVKVVNVVGLGLQLTSDPYRHDTRVASRGSVFEMVPSGEELSLGIQRSEDTDFQLDTSTLEARWSGFDDGSLSVTYTVALGTSSGVDDVSTFVAASSQHGHKFTGLSLQVDTKYHVTVKATTSAGSVIVSSDGVTVIQTDQPVSNLAIKDGPGCNHTSTAAWIPEHHKDMVEVPCEDDASFQTSWHTLWAHWSMTSAQRHRYPDVVYKVERNIPGTATWTEVTSYVSSSRNDVIMAQGLALQAGEQYRVAVKFCVSAACSLPLYSSGVYITTSPTLSGAIGVMHFNSTGVSVLEVTMEYFRDPDMTELTEAQSAVLGYQWSLSHRLQDGAEPVLTPWTDVASLQTFNVTHGRFSISLSGQVSFHKCLIVKVRGVSRTGFVTMVSSHVMDCQAFDPVLIVPRRVMDAVGVTVDGAPSQGLPVKMGFTDPWTSDDEDYTPHNNVLSAVWPTLRHTHVTWAVLESQGPDVTSLLLDPSHQALQDPCSSPLQIACGQLTTQKYINVNFGAGTSRAALQNGHHYYVCVHAQAEPLVHEKWTEHLAEVNSCSDGVTVDLTSPSAGTVTVDNLLHGLYQTSVSTISVRWKGFTDIEDMGLTAHHSGILTYYIAVGSVEGGEDVLKFHDVGLVNYHTLHTLNMIDGHVYYVTVKAFDMVGRSVMASAAGFVVDSSPPLRTTANFRFAQPYFTSDVFINLCWTDMFSDDGSGIDYFQVSVGSRPGHSDIMQGQRSETDCGQFTTDVSMINGHAYYVTVGAINKAGLEAVATSKPVVVMNTPPSLGSVFDGTAPVAGSSSTDVDFVTSVDEVRAFWNGFSTPLNPVRSYSVSLGTCPGCEDVVADFDVGLSTEVRWNEAPLRHDLRYYTTVVACNAVSQCQRVTSDGVMIDVTPPVTGPVWDGTGDQDIAYQAQRDFLGAEWRGFTDFGSGLATFTWRAGTTSGGSDVMPERDAGLVFSAFTTDLPAPLPVGQTIYITVKAIDVAGNEKEVTSNGFKVDNSSPVTSTPVELSPGVGTLDGISVVSRDMLGVRWAIEDPESHIVTQHVAVYSHIYGEFLSASVQIPGPTREYIFTSLALHDGSRYKVKVTACNLARLCTTSSSADILHDNSPPSTGMFAIHTDHSAALTRHVDTWMQWTTSSLRLAWLGFHDQHSGIHSYHVNVGSQPFANDLNQGSNTITVTHATSGSSYEDEGYVQVNEVTTKTLTALQVVYVTVWAVNGVGLKSHPAMSKFRLETGGALFLHRRCSSFNCLSQCVCGVQGATCAAASPCTQHSDASNPNSKLTVYDHADLTTLNSTTTTSGDSFQASVSSLAASWRVSTAQGQLPVRYEVSVGRSDQDSPQGVWNVLTDRVWTDVGLMTWWITAVPQDNPLTDKVSYSTFVRAWYGDGSYAIFKSSGITTRIQPPTITTVLGRAVKEHETSTGTKDVDVVTSASTLYVSWEGKFVSTTAPITSYNIYIGTTPEASDIYSGTAGGGEVKQMVTGLTLQPYTLYYSTVTTLGGSGLLTWDVSDGFILDTETPVAGMVMDGNGLEDLDYQPSDRVARANWRGFYDAGSGVRRYLWCVGTTVDLSTCDVMAWTDVGLNTSASADVGASVNQGTTLYSKVYAKDAAGHSSDVRVSDGVTVDTTPPSVLSMVYTGGLNLLFNPSFETDTASNANLTQCDPLPPTSWQITPDSCVTLHHPAHTVSSDGHQHIVLSGTLQQTVNNLLAGKVYRLTLRLAHPHNALTSQKPVTGHVTMGSSITPFALDPSLCAGVCDSGVEPVMMWHSFNYIAAASSSTLLVAVSTSTPSLDQQLAVDNVVLEEIRELASPGGSEEHSISSSGVFLPQWSVVQASWHFQEDVSPIVDYQWALGTSEGGVQLQGFSSVGRRQHASLPALSLTHGSRIYVTVLARNAAGMTSVAYSRPLVVDMTPPDVLALWDGDSGEEVDFQTSTTVGARWSVSDNQSHVGHCQWAIGTEPGRADIQSFQLATPTTPSTYTVTSDVTSALTSHTLPVMLYVSVRCYNQGGLPARGSTDGVRILSSSQSEQMGALRMLPDSKSHFPALETCLNHQDKLRLRWGSVTSPILVAGFQIVRASDAGEESSTTPTLPFLLQGADLDLGMALLTSDSNYIVSVNPVNKTEVVTSGASLQTYVLPDPPTIQANQQVGANVTGGHLSLSWPNLFQSVLDLSYEVTAGSVVGGGDILLFQQTRDTHVLVSLEHASLAAFNISVVVTAVDPCGQYAVHTQDVLVSL